MDCFNNTDQSCGAGCEGGPRGGGRLLRRISCQSILCRRANCRISVILNTQPWLTWQCKQAIITLVRILCPPVKITFHCQLYFLLLGYLEIWAHYLEIHKLETNNFWRPKSLTVTTCGFKKKWMWSLLVYNKIIYTTYWLRVFKLHLFVAEGRALNSPLLHKLPPIRPQWWILQL